MTQSFDVLILYGDRKADAQTLRDLLRTVEFTANLLEDLPDGGMTLPEKLRHYLPLARVHIGIASPDSSRKGESFPASAFVSEVTQCMEHYRDRFVLLQEEGTSWPSTLTAPVYLSFHPHRFAAVLPKIMADLLERHKENGHAPVPLGSARADHRIQLKVFMDAMDEIWEDIDFAWGRVYEQSVEHEAKVALTLDLMFKAYYDGFCAYRDATDSTPWSPTELRKKLDESIFVGERAAVEFFEMVLEWELSEVEKNVKILNRRVNVQHKTAMNRAKMLLDRMKSARGYKSQADKFKEAVGIIPDLKA